MTIMTIIGVINPYDAEIFLYKPRRPKGIFNFKMSQLALSASFEYLYHGLGSLYLFNSFSARKIILKRFTM